MMLSTLSFFITTPEAWREGPGGIPQRCSPQLSATM
jgi:uncharacterized membrane protein YkgB